MADGLQMPTVTWEQFEAPMFVSSNGLSAEPEQCLAMDTITGDLVWQQSASKESDGTRRPAWMP